MQALRHLGARALHLQLLGQAASGSVGAVAAAARRCLVTAAEGLERAPPAFAFDIDGVSVFLVYF